MDADLPAACKCGAHFLYWTMADGKHKKLSEMDLGHLTNSIKMLSAKIEEEIDSKYRARLEIAMDLLYLEIQNRDKEIDQLSRIGGALTRALNAG